MWKSASHAPSLRVFTLAFALQLRKKHGKTTVRLRETSVRLIKTCQSTVYILPRHTHTHTHTHTHIYILQNLYISSDFS
jgi:hypothetical protein